MNIMMHILQDGPRQLQKTGVTEDPRKSGTLWRIRIHDLRHTFASLLIQQGESLVYVKQQMGHHSIRVTVDTYGHLVPGGNRAAVDRLDTPVRNLPGATSATQTQPLTAWLSWQRADLLKRHVEPKGIEPSTSRVRF